MRVARACPRPRRPPMVHTKLQIGAWASSAGHPPSRRASAGRPGVVVAGPAGMAQRVFGRRRRRVAVLGAGGCLGSVGVSPTRVFSARAAAASAGRDVGDAHWTVRRPEQHANQVVAARWRRERPRQSRPPRVRNTAAIIPAALAAALGAVPSSTASGRWVASAVVPVPYRSPDRGRLSAVPTGQPADEPCAGHSG